MKSTVKWFDNRRGFGFINNPDKGEDIFIHYQALEGKGFKTLNEGQHVEFEVEKTYKGLQAKHVKPTENLQTIK